MGTLNPQEIETAAQSMTPIARVLMFDFQLLVPWVALAAAVFGIWILSFVTPAN